jgi:transposase
LTKTHAVFKWRMDEKDLLIHKLMDRITALERLVEQQAAQIAVLEKRLGKNSSNSSNPPSSDGFTKPPRTGSLRKTGKNKSGGQRGHKGETLRQSQTPDKVERHLLIHCPECLGSLESVPATGITKRQVFDIPAPKIEITEHQAEVKICPCCNKRVAAEFPDGVNAPVQYGKVIQGWGIYFQYQQFIPEDRLQEMFADLLNIRLATSTLNSFGETLYDSLADFEAGVLSKVQAAPVKHLDETGFRIAGSTQWLHVASTDQLTYYHISPKRKSLLEGLTGTVVHDHWKPYYQLPGVRHGLCNQHHLRELKALVQYDKESWARKMQRFLRTGLHYRHIHGEKMIPDEVLTRLTSLYDRILQEGISWHENQPVFSKRKGRGRQARRTGHNLLIRLSRYRDDALRFLTDPSVPFTNNQAERDIRMMKCRQKISGGFRTGKGAGIFTRIRGFISTARKQGWNIFESIQQAIHGNIPVAG